MNCNHKFKEANYYTSVTEIPESVWTELDCNDHLYFHSDYLQSIEQNHSHLDFFYVVLKDEQQKSFAFASVQVLDFNVEELQNDANPLFKTIATLARKVKILPKEKPLKILNCGNTFVSGEHGIFLKKDKRKSLRKLVKAILSYSQEKYQKDKIDIFIMKDFLESSLPISNELISLGYYAFNVEPNMKLTLESEWSSFDDYLAALKTKFRVKAKKALQLSAPLSTQEITPENIEGQIKEMTLLYERVASKADFNLGKFNIKAYKDLKSALKDSYVLRSYWLENKMVGFLSGMINEKSLDAHFVGIDYELNKPYAIYQRMLYDYITIAISNELKVLNFGRTASEIKSSIGAVPEHLTIYIRHKKTITNKFLKLFLLKIQPTEFNQKFPFKTKA